MAIDAMGDEFHFGRRQIVVYGTTAQPSYRYVPLSPADFLDPQPGDQFVLGPRHDDDVQQLVHILRHVHRYAPFLTVFSRLKVVWDQGGLARPMPDILVAPHVIDPGRPRAEFAVAAEGSRPRFVLEVTSPRLAELDLGPKVAIYQQGGVEEYFILDSGEREAGDEATYRVLGYRLQAGGYVRLAPDEAGRLHSAVNDVWIGPNERRDGFVVVSGRTGQPVHLADTAPPPSADEGESEGRQRASAIADQLSALLSDLRP